MGKKSGRVEEVNDKFLAGGVNTTPKLVNSLGDESGG